MPPQHPAAVYKIVPLINASIQTWQLMRANQEFTQPLSMDPGGPVAEAPLPARKPYGCRSSGVHGRRVFWWSHSCNSTASNSFKHLGVAEENLASGVLNQRTPKQGTLKLAKPQLLNLPVFAHFSCYCLLAFLLRWGQVLCGE